MPTVVERALAYCNASEVLFRSTAECTLCGMKPMRKYVDDWYTYKHTNAGRY